jgi:hypothetical protein
MTTSVKYIHGGMPGAPSVANNWGDLTNMLDAVLVNGFNSRTPTDITLSGNTVTITFGVAHGYQIYQIIEVGGADQPEYNGQHRVTSITTNTVSFLIAGTPTSPATGTFTCKVAPLGFQIAFTGTNKRAYRSPNVQGNRPFLRVDDSLPAGYTTTWAKFARVTIAENMTDVDTFVGPRAPFDPGNPTANEIPSGTGTTGIYGWYKWYYAVDTLVSSRSESTGDGGAVSKNWSIVGDDRGFYLVISGHFVGGNRMLYAFGEFPSYKAGDAYNTLLFAIEYYGTAGTATQIAWSTRGGNLASNDTPGRVAMRGWQQIGNPTRLAIFSLNTTNGTVQSGSTAQAPFPNNPDMGTIVHPVYIREESPSNLRGVLPGAYWALQSNAHLHRTILDNLVGLPNRALVYLSGIQNYNVSDGSGQNGIWFDITGPWQR